MIPPALACRHRPGGKLNRRRRVRLWPNRSATTTPGNRSSPCRATDRYDRGVEGGRTTVESDENDQENLTDAVRSMAGWDESGDPQELENAQVGRNDDEVVLPPPL